MVDGLLVALVLLNVYIVALFVLHQRGKLKGPVLELVGPLLLWRTERGKQLIDRLAQPLRLLWRGYGDVGVVLTFVAGLGVLALLVWQVSLLFTHREILEAAAPGPEYFLVLPGVNPLIPLWYGLLGLVVALVVHEGAHGILARAHDIKVKSLGLLFLVVPIGAFVEPDEEELERARTRAKARVFAAGVMTNVAVAVVAAMLFSGAFWASAQPAQEGLAVSGVIPGLGAEQAGLAPGMVITAIEGRAVRNLEDFNASLSQKHAGESVGMSLWHRGQVLEKQVPLTDKYAYYEQNDPARNREEFKGRGFMGVTTFPMEALGALRDVNAAPLDFGVGGIAFYVSQPFPVFGGAGFSPLPSAFQDLFVIEGPLAALPPSLFWVLANSLYWVFWLNLMVGTFNALPAGPLDGGQMFKAILKGALRRYFGVRHEQLVVERAPVAKQVVVRGTDSATQAKVERIEGIVRSTTLAVGLAILGLILVPILGPQLL